MKKCICIERHTSWGKEFDLLPGDIFLFDREKIKFNTKNGKFKVVKPSQIGDWHYYIYDLSEELVYSCKEDFFLEYFSTKQFEREEKLNKIISQ